ncbi:MAG: tRNA (adenosine(37)-N6)-threonylcarbamoyltransferase complex ATPase subunit type 1 TsaE [Chloroflexi bacterium]|nr:MAG: tRNA (adenosine(37)-N6)-threonylcarbamoyltransferase complex ATPase subunit type 1 TsaE [Chloroflexota bacterium]
MSADWLTRSPAETEQAGEDFAALVTAGDLLLLEGELGSGKTTFVRGLARGLGSVDAVQSPTFTLVRIYKGRIPLAHVDLFRLQSATELADLGLEELLDQAVVAVEWGDRLAADDARARRLKFDVTGPDERRIRVLRS